MTSEANVYCVRRVWNRINNFSFFFISLLRCWLLLLGVCATTQVCCRSECVWAIVCGRARRDWCLRHRHTVGNWIVCRADHAARSEPYRWLYTPLPENQHNVHSLEWAIVRWNDNHNKNSTDRSDDNSTNSSAAHSNCISITLWIFNSVCIWTRRIYIFFHYLSENETLPLPKSNTICNKFEFKISKLIALNRVTSNRWINPLTKYRTSFAVMINSRAFVCVCSVFASVQRALAQRHR